MAIQGFDANYFVEALFEYAQAEYSEWAADKTAEDIEELLMNLYPESDDLSAAAQAGYLDFGIAWGIEPNAYFDSAEYRQAWAEMQVDENMVFTLEAALEAYDAAVAEMPEGAYGHYLEYGAAMGVNPSNDFDDSDYYQSLIDGLDLSYEDGTMMTVEELRALAVESGLNALTFFVDNPEFADAYPAVEVSADEQVVVDVTTAGETYALTSDTDALTGTAGDDLFQAMLAQNTGGISNTLASGDVIDGGAGEDTLFAQLIPEFVGDDNDDINLEGILSPKTTSVEVAKFQVQQSTAEAEGDSEGLSGIDAQDMDGVRELWSTNSRADLVIEDVRTLSMLVTIGMEKTDGSSVGAYTTEEENNTGIEADYSVNFAPEALVPADTSDSFIDLLLDDQTTDDGDLTNVTVHVIQFLYDANQDGEYELIQLVKNDDNGMDQADTHEELAAAISAELEAQGYDDLAANVTFDGNEIRITDPNAVQGNATFVALDGETVPEGYGDYETWNVSFASEADVLATSDTVGLTPDNLVETNVILDDVGRGTDGGYLNVGSIGTSGVQQFNIEVGADSSVGSLSSFNRSQSDGVPMNERLEAINIEDLNEEGDADFGSSLVVGNGNSILGTLAGSAINSGLWNVSDIAAESYTGDLTIALQLDNGANLSGAGDHMAEQLYLDPAIAWAEAYAVEEDTSLTQALYDSKVVFDYALGSGNDTFILDVDDVDNSLFRNYADYVDAKGNIREAITELNIDAGDGDDHVLLDAPSAAAGVTIVDGGEGENTFEVGGELFSENPGLSVDGLADGNHAGAFGYNLGSGREFAGEEWYADENVDVEGFVNFQNLLVSDALGGGDVYLDLDNMTWNNGADKIGGIGHTYEITNDDITVLDNVRVDDDPDSNNGLATDVVLTGVDGAAPAVGDVFLFMEDVTDDDYADVVQEVLLNNTGRSEDVMTVNSLTVIDADEVIIDSQGTSNSQLANGGAPNVINAFESNADTLTIVGTEDLNITIDENRSFDIYENLGLTLDFINDQDNVDEIDASAFEGNLTIIENDNDNGVVIMGGSGNDWIDANDGGDTLTGNAGVDTFFYGAVTDSYVADGEIENVDYITDLDFDGGDRIDISTIQTAPDFAIAAEETVDLHEDSLLSDLNDAFTASEDVNYANIQIITDDGSEDDDAADLEDRSYLVVDLDGSNTIDQNDLVIDITGFEGDVSLDNFIYADLRDPIVGSMIIEGNQIVFSSDEAGNAYFENNNFANNNGYDVSEGLNSTTLVYEDEVRADRLVVVDADGNDVQLGEWVVLGTPNDDLIAVGNGASNGDDLIFGFGGADNINAGAGDDFIAFDEDDAVDGGAGMDAIVGSSGIDEIDLADYDNVENLLGGNGKDELFGDNADNVISGGLGDDVIDARDGDDTIVVLGDISAGDYEVADLAGTGAEALGLAYDVLYGTSSYVDKDDYDGGLGNDTLEIWGNADFTDADIAGIENIDIHSIVEFTEEQIEGSDIDFTLADDSIVVIHDADGDITSIYAADKRDVEDAFGDDDADDFWVDPEDFGYDENYDIGDVADLLTDYADNGIEAMDDDYSYVAGSTHIIDVLANDLPAGLEIDSVDNEDNVDVTINDDDTLTIVVGDDIDGEVGEASFTYMVTDGDYSETAMVTIDVLDAPVNNAPVAADDAATTAQGVAVSIDVLDNDTDAEGDALTINAVDAIDAAVGTTAIVGGEVLFTPAADYFGVTTFDYDVVDAFGGVDTATVTVTVTEDNGLDYTIQTVPNTGDFSYDADALRAAAGEDFVYFDFDAPPANSGLGTIANFDNGDRLITGFDLDAEALFIEGVDGATTGTISVAFGENVMSFTEIWSVGITGVDAAVVDEVQAENGDLAAQIETLGVAFGTDWIMDALI